MRIVMCSRMEEEKGSEIMGMNHKLGTSKASSSDSPRTEKWHFLSRTEVHRTDMLQREAVVCLFCICRGTSFENHSLKSGIENIYCNQK